MRVLCLYLPGLGMQLVARRRPELAGRPVVMLDGAGASATVVEARGALPGKATLTGIPAAQARARCPRAVFLPDNLGDCLDELERVAAVVSRQATPLVEVGGRSHVFVDLAGLDGRFASEVQAAERIAGLVSEWSGLAVRAGVAGARAEALEAARGARSGPMVVAPAGQLALDHERPIRGSGEVSGSEALPPGTDAERARERLAALVARVTKLVTVSERGFRRLEITIEGAGATQQIRARSAVPVLDPARALALVAGPVSSTTFDGAARLSVTASGLVPSCASTQEARPQRAARPASLGERAPRRERVLAAAS